jgi:hypothetical protein
MAHELIPPSLRGPLLSPLARSLTWRTCSSVCTSLPNASRTEAANICAAVTVSGTKRIRTRSYADSAPPPSGAAGAPEGSRRRPEASEGVGGGDPMSINSSAAASISDCMSSFLEEVNDAAAARVD